MCFVGGRYGSVWRLAEALRYRPLSFHRAHRADAVRAALRIFDGESILVSEGDEWRQQRHLLQQGFRSEALRGYARKAIESTRTMLLRWPAAGPIRVHNEMEQLCMKTLSHVLFGTHPPQDIADSIRIVLDARALEIENVVSSVRRPAIGGRRERDQALSHVHRFLDDLIQTRRAETEDVGDMLGMLVRASQRDSEEGKNQRQVDRQIRDETISMINASMDATSAAMSWTLFLVAKHPIVQEKVREESEQAAGKHAEAVADDVELPYAEMVVHESLRLYPPNWVLITRRCLQESAIGDYRVPRGSWFFVFPYVLHRDSRWFTNPESFAPDRFASEIFGPLQRSAYIPLGLGPHVCIGKALSTIILTSILASILQEFRLELPPNQTEAEPDVGIVIRPKNGLRLYATRDRIGYC